MDDERQEYLGAVWQLLFTQLRRHLVRPLCQWEPADFLAQAANTQLHGNEILKDSLADPVYQAEDHRLYYAFVTEIAWLVEKGGEFGEPCAALRHVRMGLQQYGPLFQAIYSETCASFVLQWQPMAALRLLGEEWELAFGLRQHWQRHPVDSRFMRRLWQNRCHEYPRGSYATASPSERMVHDFFRTILRGIRAAGSWPQRLGCSLTEDLCIVACAFDRNGVCLERACHEFAQAWIGSDDELPWLAQSHYGWVRAVAKTRLENHCDPMDKEPWARY